MENSNLRKVIFTLNGSDVFGYQQLSLGDIVAGGKDPEEYNKEREGIFHCWGNGIQLSDEGQPIPVTFAIIEMPDGQVVQIPPRNVKFVK